MQNVTITRNKIVNLFSRSKRNSTTFFHVWTLFLDSVPINDFLSRNSITAQRCSQPNDDKF